MKIDLSTKTIKKQIIRIQHFIYLLKFIYDMKKTIIFLFSISALNLAYAQSDSKLQKKFAKERIENINFRTNNCTICTVHNPSKNIISNSIIKTGHIK